LARHLKQPANCGLHARLWALCRRTELRHGGCWESAAVLQALQAATATSAVVAHKEMAEHPNEGDPW
jgi:hypothetical protein